MASLVVPAGNGPGGTTPICIASHVQMCSIIHCCNQCSLMECTTYAGVGLTISPYTANQSLPHNKVTCASEYSMHRLLLQLMLAKGYNTDAGVGLTNSPYTANY